MNKRHKKKIRKFCDFCGYSHNSENKCKNMKKKLKKNSVEDLDPLKLPTEPKTYNRLEIYGLESLNTKIIHEEKKEIPNLFTLLETHKCDSCDKLYFTEADFKEHLKLVHYPWEIEQSHTIKDWHSKLSVQLMFKRKDTNLKL